MTSPDDRAPIDPVFEGLFRPDEVAAPEAGAPEVVAPAIVEAPPAPEAPEAPPTPPVVVESSLADTGRLFRSQGAQDHDDAVLAVEGRGRLRTLERSTSPATEESPTGDEADSGGAPDADDLGSRPAEASEVPVEKGSRGHRRQINAAAVYLIVFGVTIIVAFLNALLASGHLGWPTGVALLIASVYAALSVRRADDTVAMIVPPLAFVVAALTAGQINIGAVEGSLFNRAAVVFFTLAENWVWIILATLASAVIVLVRRKRA